MILVKGHRTSSNKTGMRLLLTANQPSWGSSTVALLARRQATAEGPTVLLTDATLAEHDSGYSLSDRWGQDGYDGRTQAPTGSL